MSHIGRQYRRCHLPPKELTKEEIKKLNKVKGGGYAVTKEQNEKIISELFRLYSLRNIIKVKNDLQK